MTVALEKEETKQEKKDDDKEGEEEYNKFYVDSDVELRATCIYRAQEKWVHTDTVA